jgi:hypothetical protein
MSSSTFEFSFAKFNFSESLTKNSSFLSDSSYFEIEILNRNNTQPFTISISLFPQTKLSQLTFFTFKFDFNYNKINKIFEFNQKFHKEIEKHEISFEMIKIQDIIDKPLKFIGTITEIISKNQIFLISKHNTNYFNQISTISTPNTVVSEQTSSSTSIHIYQLTEVFLEFSPNDFSYMNSFDNPFIYSFNSSIFNKLFSRSISFANYYIYISIHSQNQLLLETYSHLPQELSFNILVCFLFVDDKHQAFEHNSIIFTPICPRAIISFPIKFDHSISKCKIELSNSSFDKSNSISKPVVLPFSSNSKEISPYIIKSSPKEIVDLKEIQINLTNNDFLLSNNSPSKYCSFFNS